MPLSVTLPQQMAVMLGLALSQGPPQDHVLKSLAVHEGNGPVTLKTIFESLLSSTAAQHVLISSKINHILAASPEVVGFDVVIPAADRAIQPLKGVNGCMQRLSFIPRMFMV